MNELICKICGFTIYPEIKHRCMIFKYDLPVYTQDQADERTRATLRDLIDERDGLLDDLDVALDEIDELREDLDLAEGDLKYVLERDDSREEPEAHTEYRVLYSVDGNYHIPDHAGDTVKIVRPEAAPKFEKSVIGMPVGYRLSYCGGEIRLVPIDDTTKL